MNNTALKWGTSIMLALATLAATPAMARDDRGRQGYSHRDNDRHDRRHERDRRHDRRDDRRHARRDGDYDSRGYRGDRRYDYRQPVRVVHHRPVVRHVYHPSQRYSAPPRWARGGYVHQYHRPTYVVRDYRGYGLRQPPRGHHWVRDDYGDYLLVAIATGLIADLILNR